jgi:glycerol-3-phosphate dehydrogenase subunit B
MAITNRSLSSTVSLVSKLVRNELTVDVIVLGGGAAGLLAAMHTAERGNDVLLLSRGYGNTSMATGLIDLLAYMPSTTEYISKPIEGIRELVSITPIHHPYAVVSAQDTREATRLVQRSVEDFLERSGRYGLPYTGTIYDNIWVLTHLATAKPTAIVSKYVYNGKLDELLSTRNHVLLVGFGNRIIEYNPKYIMQSIMELSRLLPIRGDSNGFGGSGNGLDCTFDVLNISLPILDKYSVDTSLPELVPALNMKTTFRELLAELQQYVQHYKVTHIGLPTIFDSDHVTEYMDTLATELGCIVFEIPDTCSYAGIRFQAVLERMAKASGVKILHGYNIDKLVLKDNNECVAVNISSRRKQFTCYGTTFILATGDIVSGGLRVTHNKIFEPLTGITVYDAGASAFGFRNAVDTEPFPPKGHLISRVGVTVNSQLHPVDARGNTLIDNLYVIGSTLAGYDYVTEKSGLGVCLTTAYRASELCTGCC